MNFNIYIEDSLGEYLDKATRVTGKSKNALIREALKEWAINHPMTSWPKDVSQHKGIEDSIVFEETRSELETLAGDPLA